MKSQPQTSQFQIFKVPLNRICDLGQELCRLADRIDWKVFEEEFGALYCENNGRPAKSIRLIVGMHFLKSMFQQSDEDLVEKWVQNPYWQYFCGEKEFQHEFPLEPTSLGKWRKRVGEGGFEELLKSTIQTGLQMGVLKMEHLKRVNVDTTVQEKAITHPTDAKLYHRMREKLVKEAAKENVELRQSYRYLSKKALFMHNRYRFARQGKRANRELRKLKTYLGRVTRDIERKVALQSRSEALQNLLQLANRLLLQKRQDSKKLYSIHAPEVECIAKGKAHKKYEFGCKVSVVTSSKGNFFLGSFALHGNPFDGHTLKDSLRRSQNFFKTKIEQAVVDQGYRGHGVDDIHVHIAGRNRKRLKPSLRRWLKRRAAIEPLIGPMKNDGGPKRNHLLGKEGDKVNALMMGVGFNLRKLARSSSWSHFWQWIPKILEKIQIHQHQVLVFESVLGFRFSEKVMHNSA